MIECMYMFRDAGRHREFTEDARGKFEVCPGSGLVSVIEKDGRRCRLYNAEDHKMKFQGWRGDEMAWDDGIQDKKVVNELKMMEMAINGR